MTLDKMSIYKYQRSQNVGIDSVEFVSFMTWDKMSIHKKGFYTETKLLQAKKQHALKIIAGESFYSLFVVVEA